MPNYTGRCTGHGEFEEYMGVSQYLSEGLKCPDCGEDSRVVIRKAPGIIGPLPTKRLNIDQIGQSFGSAAEERAYFKNRPDRVVVAKNDTEFIRHRDLAREKADIAAKRLGFRDLDDRRVFAKKEKAQKRRIASGERKIQITTS